MPVLKGNIYDHVQTKITCLIFLTGITEFIRKIVKNIKNKKSSDAHELSLRKKKTCNAMHSEAIDIYM